MADLYTENRDDQQLAEARAQLQKIRDVVGAEDFEAILQGSDPMRGRLEAAKRLVERARPFVRVVYFARGADALLADIDAAIGPPASQPTSGSGR